jgi:hypothetical protein
MCGVCQCMHQPGVLQHLNTVDEAFLSSPAYRGNTLDPTGARSLPVRQSSEFQQQLHNTAIA